MTDGSMTFDFDFALTVLRPFVRLYETLDEDEAAAMFDEWARRLNELDGTDHPIQDLVNANQVPAIEFGTEVRTVSICLPLSTGEQVKTAIFDTSEEHNADRATITSALAHDEIQRRPVPHLPLARIDPCRPERWDELTQLDDDGIVHATELELPARCSCPCDAKFVGSAVLINADQTTFTAVQPGHITRFQRRMRDDDNIFMLLADEGERPFGRHFATNASLTVSEERFERVMQAIGTAEYGEELLADTI